MSKAFTKDEGDPVAEIVVPARAPLPEGAMNYVTPRGLALLREELRTLEAEQVRAASASEDAEARREAAVIAARVAQVSERVASAVVVEPAGLPRDEARFGARVVVETEAGEERVYRIVGVDEADAARGDVAFVSPVARALLGKKVGDVAVVRTPRGEEELSVVAIEYDGDARGAS